MLHIPQHLDFFLMFFSDTDEEELNRLAEAAVSGHSIFQNGKKKL